MSRISFSPSSDFCYRIENRKIVLNVPVDLFADAVVEEPVLVFVGVGVVEALEVLAHEYQALDAAVAVEWEL